MKNEKLLKRILAVLLIATMTAANLAACDEDEADDVMQIPTIPDEEIVSVQEEDETGLFPPYELIIIPPYETERIPTNLPDYDWDGYNFRVLTGIWKEVSWSMLNVRDITTEELTGEPLNDAVYMRNIALEEKYNFTIEQVFSPIENPIETVRRAVRAGDSNFDVASIPIFSITRSIQNGFFVDLFTVDYLDFEKPWWDQGAVRDLSINNKLYFTSGDSVLLNKGLCPTILFNKELLADLQLENPYELVRNGKWTIGRLHEMSRAAAADLDGDGVMNSDVDRFGFIPDSLVPVADFMHGMGVRYGAKDANDLPVVIFGSERGFTAVQLYTDFIRSDFHMDWGWLLTGEDDRSFIERAFTENRGLFLGTVVLTVETLRRMNTDFGILPMPWLDENQREWGHSTHLHHGQGLVIPNFHGDSALDRVGFMLEAIAAESRYTINPAYHDIQLAGKFTRDDESKEMLDIIFSTLVWDIGIMYDWFGFTRGHGPLRYTASFFESERGKIEAAVQATIDAFANID
jgi:hypothetical protein